MDNKNYITIEDAALAINPSAKLKSSPADDADGITWLDGTAPILTESSALYSSPLPHVLILTAIVVGISTTALGLAIIIRIHNAFGTIEDDKIQQEIK